MQGETTKKLRVMAEDHESPERTWNIVNRLVEKSAKYSGLRSLKSLVPMTA